MGAPMRLVATLLAIPLLSGCALLMASSMSGSMTITHPAGYQITCGSGPVPIASDPQSIYIDASDCTRIAEDGVSTFMAEHPGAKVDSVTVEADKVTSVCYTLDGTSACFSVSK
jgi:hypothetical protein